MSRLFTALLVVFIAASHPTSGQQQARLGVTAPAFVAVQVRDVVEAAAWYSRVFGLAEVRRIDDPERGLSIRILSDSVLRVELIQASPAEEPPTRHFGLFKAGLFVEDIDAAHRWLRTHGVSTDERVFTDPTLRLRSFVFRDLEGNRLQAFQSCAGPCS